ncbi:hypothetical protein [Geomonas sp.]|uniref:hypothetical protein n=1 Tax=Geomonas sp. TaxID=2651584 RepID=UPI002B45BD13|nr:hypothetical protein [Geomonas sp.]HJV36786.1 hypothetical protein [Geomonas sp.]
MGQQMVRIMRSYRYGTPSKFHEVNQRVSASLTDNDKFPESTWGANPTLLPTYLATSKKQNEVYLRARHGSRLDIAEREVLQAQLIQLLDEIALVLEAAAIRNPEILLHSGFELAKERRSRPRVKAPITVSEASVGEHQEGS